MYNILRLGPNFHMIASRNKDYVYPLSHIFQTPLDPFKPFLDRILEYFWILGPSVLVLLIIIGTYVGLKEKRRETLILLAWGILPIIAAAEFSKTMTARYIYFSVPYLYIISSLAFGYSRYSKPINFGGRLRWIIGKRIVTGLMIVFVLHSLYLDYQYLTDPQSANLPRSERSGYLEEWTSGYGIKEVSEYVREEHWLNPDQKFVVGTEGYFGTLPDGLQMYLNDVPEIIVIGVGLSLKDAPESLKESKLAGNKTYLVVNSSRFLGDLETSDLELLATYGKAVRPDGSREALLLFEVTDKSLKN